MADAKTPETKAPEVVIKNKLVLKDMGNPAKVKELDGDKAKHILGTILGVATGVRRRANKADPTKMDEGLTGTFEGVPTDAKLDRVQSGVLYLPEGMFQMIAAKLEGENAADSVQFAIEVATVKAQNPAGYTWAFTPKIAVMEADPLASMREQLKIGAIGSVQEPKKVEKAATK